MTGRNATVSESAFFVGIDENGLGPRLGPLIVTSILAEVTPRGARMVTSRPRGALSARIGDSKKLVTRGDTSLGEAWARAIALRSGRVAECPAELLAFLFLDPDVSLRASCPAHHVDLCWSTEGEAFQTSGSDVARLIKDLDVLESKGVRISRARVAVVCAKRLNEAASNGMSRFDVDLHTMERLALDARAQTTGDVYAVCGKVGGFSSYGDRFGPLADYPRRVIQEGRGRSEYEVRGVGRLAFVRDGDDTHLIIGLASLIGKWARDHLMHRVVRYHRTHDRESRELPDASGYHDPVTSRFIRASEIIRKNRNVQHACFERRSIGSRA